jgi:hypothetical protein
MGIEEADRIFSRNPRKIKNKKECYLLYELGFFGNKPLTWRTYEDIIDSGYSGDVVIRGRRSINRDKVKYNVSLDEAREKIRELESQGIHESDLAFNQAMPDEHLTIQGELIHNTMLPPYGLYLLYSMLKKPMNISLEEDSHEAYGLQATNLLKSSMTASSFSDMEALMEMFPESAIEFSTYDICVGNIPGRNTVIWEVRNY